MVQTKYKNIQEILKFKLLFLQDVLNRPAEEFGNDDMLEGLWAKKAFEHAETHVRCY